MIVLLACATTEDPAVVEMEPLRVLNRASLDLRGIRPTEAEIEAVEADPSALPGLLDAFVEDPRFPERLVQLYHEIYLTESEGFDLRSDALPVDDPRAFYWEVGQEPLRIIAEVAKDDLPYSEVVLGDWTMATDQMAGLFPLELEPGSDTWRRAHYTDGRPAAGVMATTGLWWRYTSTETNANRRRANALTTVLVCQNHLERPIAFDQDVNLLDDAAIRDAIRTNPSCVNCHTSLDPVAANLFGFYWSNFTSPTQGSSYHPGRERLWVDLLDGVEPAWFGTPTGGLAGLGRVIVADPRFPSCAVQQAFERMLRRDVTVEDTDALTTLRESFLTEGMRLKALYRAVVDLPAYRAADDSVGTGVPLKLMAPDVLGTSVEALTGFTWERDGIPVMTTDRTGLRGLGGGVNGLFIKRPAEAPGSSTLLVQMAIADEAASYAVATEQAMAPDERRLFTEIDFTETDPAVIRAQLRTLHVRVLGERIAEDDPDLDALVSLWSSVAELEGSPALAWQGVLEALLRDPSYLLY